jgi:hypothetical protein
MKYKEIDKYEKPDAVVIRITGTQDLVSISKSKHYKRVEHYHCSQSHGYE